MVKEGGLKPSTRRNYEGKLDFLQKWLNGDEHITYIYQFNKNLIMSLIHMAYAAGIVQLQLIIAKKRPAY